MALALAGRAAAITVMRADRQAGDDTLPIWLFFGRDSQAIPESGKALLRDQHARLGRRQSESSTHWLVITGHGEDASADGANRELGQRRADAVRDYLVELGLNARRIAAAGRGRGSAGASGKVDFGLQGSASVASSSGFDLRVD